MNATNENDDIPNHEPLSRGLIVSAVLHVVLSIAFAVKAIFFTPEAIDFAKAVRVDLVALPDKIEQEPEPEAAPASKTKEKVEAPKPEPVKKQTTKEVELQKPPQEIKTTLPQKTEKVLDEINLDQVKSKQKNALEKLKAMAAMEKFKEELSKKKTSAPSYKGSVISPGTALTGLSKLQHDSYTGLLDNHIKQNWSLPEWLANREFRAQARVFIDSKGNILDRKIVKSSGNPSYDEAVLLTIDKSAPFPAPPEKFAALVSIDGILIGFPE